MKEIIKGLEFDAAFEFSQKGMTPRTNFQGSQEEHDKMHEEKGQNLLKAAHASESPIGSYYHDSKQCATICLEAIIKANPTAILEIGWRNGTEERLRSCNKEKYQLILKELKRL